VSELNFDIARSAIAERVSASSLEHCEATAATAELLAKVYGVDSHGAYLAGLLHDWAREDASAYLIRRAQEIGVPVGPVEMAVPYLLHADVGAYELGARFAGISPTVLEAIRRHTLGAVSMSELDMVIYIADMIEPGRRYEGATHLRSLVGDVTLFELYASSYQMSFCQLIRERKHLHPTTVDAWNAIVDAMPEQWIQVS